MIIVIKGEVGNIFQGDVFVFISVSLALQLVHGELKPITLRTQSRYNIHVTPV